MDTTDLVSILRQQAQEIADEGHVGWGNTMQVAAAEIARLRFMACQPKDKHKPGCDCIQCVPF